MLTQSLAGLPSFLAYFATAIGLLALFLLAYLFVTPYREIALIRAGNAAAAASLSVGLLDMTVWGLVALVVQLLVYLAARLLLPDLVRDIPAGRIASGLLLGALSLAVGILNAACMTY